jgi:hypothetical protein
LNYGYHISDPDIACDNYDLNIHVVKYNQNNDPTANGITIYNNSDGTGTPTNGYYSRAGDVWYSTSGVLSGEAVCYSGPPPPPPTTAPPPPPPPVTYDYYDYERCVNPNAYAGPIYTIQVVSGAGYPPTIIVGGACHSIYSVTPTTSATYSIPSYTVPGIPCACE